MAGIVDTLTSLLGDPAVSSIVEGAASGISSIANNPEVTSIVGSALSVITNGNPSPQTSVEPPPSSSTSSTYPSDTLTTPVPASSLASPPEKKASSPNIGAIVGGVVGGIVALAIVAALAWFCLSRRDKRRQKKRDPLFEDERFVQTDGTPGVVDPYAGGLNRAPTLMSSASSVPSPYFPHTPQQHSPPTMTKAQMAREPAPLTNSHASIPTVATGGTFGPHRSTDTFYTDSHGVVRSNTVTSTMSTGRPLPAVPLSRNTSISHGHEHGFGITNVSGMPGGQGLGRPAAGAPGLGVPGGHTSHPGPLTPYDEEVPVVEHAVDAGTVGRKEMLPPMYDPGLYHGGQQEVLGGGVRR